MKNFVDLCFKLEECEEVTLKLKYIVQYLRKAPKPDAELTIWLLNSNKPSQIINTSLIKKWILNEAGLPEWLYDESQDFVKDAEETLSLIVEQGDQDCEDNLTEWVCKNVNSLKSMSTEQQRLLFLQQFLCLRKRERLIYLKLLTGKLKICVDKKTTVKALSTFSSVDEEVINYRLSRINNQQYGFYEKLFEQNDLDLTNCRPYPFMSVERFEINEHSDFNAARWIAEWKWRGIRVQIVKRENKVYIWSKSHEYLSDKFPDLVEELLTIPDNIVLDGQLTCGDGPDDAIIKRINTKLSPGIIEKYPVKFIAFDILECDGKDVRNESLISRKNILRSIFSSFNYNCMQAAEFYTFSEYDELHTLSSGVDYNYAEGLLIKDTQTLYNNNDLPYWYTIKKERSKINAVLLYIQRDYQNYEPGKNTIKIMTFGVPDGETFVSVAKTDCNLSYNELLELENYIKENTIERVGPIRVLKPELVFELTFEEIILSKRHKSGINIISPEISKWDKNLSISDVKGIDHLKILTCR